MFEYRVLVSSNCQTAGLALALKAFLPKAKITALPLVGEGVVSKIEAIIEDYDFWVVGSKESKFLDIVSNTKKIIVPRVLFNAFHPDMVMVPGKKGACQADYHSALVLAAYRQGLSVSQCAKLFNRDSFQELGYFDRWDQSINQLKNEFSASSLSFRELLPHLISRAPFMYSVNHPHAFVLTEMARQISIMIHGNDGVKNLCLDNVMHDTLSSLSSWAIYPEIGAQFGVNSSYVWKLPGSKFVTSLEDFIEASYHAYKDENVGRWILPNRDWDSYSNLMNKAA